MNARISAMRCLRCGETFPAGDYPSGCPECLNRGERASVTFVYEGAASFLSEYRGLRRYSEFLPYNEFPTLGEGDTPLIPLDRLAKELGCAGIYSKNEFQNPSGSHKDRMNPLVVARALDMGSPVIACASSGNQAASLALYAAAAGLPCRNVSSEEITPGWLTSSIAAGAGVILTKTSEDRLRYLQEKIDRDGWYCVTNQLIPPVGSSCFGIQGYKTIAYEIFEQTNGKNADVIFVPTCRGDLLYGIFEGFQDLMDLGLISHLPRLAAVEPMPRLERVLAGEDYKKSFPGEFSLTPSLGGGTVTYQSVLALQKSGGFAVSVPQREVAESVLAMAGYGLYLEASSAILYGGVKKALAEGAVDGSSSLILIATSHGFKNDGKLLGEDDFRGKISRTG